MCYFLFDALSFFIRRDFLRAAVLAWMTLRLAALSSELMASVTATVASSPFLAATNFSARVTLPFTPLLTALLR